MALDTNGYDVSSTLAGKGEQITCFLKKENLLAQLCKGLLIFFSNFPTVPVLPPSSPP